MLQPFKYITVVMKDRTNHGMQENDTGKPNMKPLIMLTDDMRYQPVTLDDEGYGVPFNDTTKQTHVAVGILMESFNKTFAQHKVMIQGIVTMKCDATVKPGMPVYWDVANKKVVKSVTADTPYIGKALTKTKTDGTTVDVLLG